jgi:hypothetical protein
MTPSDAGPAGWRALDGFIRTTLYVSLPEMDQSQMVVYESDKWEMLLYGRTQQMGLSMN